MDPRAVNGGITSGFIHRPELDKISYMDNYRFYRAWYLSYTQLSELMWGALGKNLSGSLC